MDCVISFFMGAFIGGTIGIVLICCLIASRDPHEDFEKNDKKEIGE